MSLCAAHRQAVVGIAVCAAVGCAHAQSQEKTPERLKLSADIAQSQDNNFQRAPDAKAVSDLINVQTLDVKIALPYGQQRLELDANLANSRHQTFTQFDYTGQNYNAAWRWSLSPTILGVLGTKRTETLNPAADSIDPTLRNKNVTTVDNLTAGYLLGGPWQLFADYSKGTSVNERAVLGTTDIRYQSYTAGVSYAPSAGNTVNYARRIDTGSSISDYSYSGHAFVATYALTTNTSIKGRLAYLEQRFSADPKFDFSGTIGSVEGTWKPTAKTTIAAGWLRDLASFQTADSTYAQTDTFSFSPSWQIRSTLALGLVYRQGVRDSMGGSSSTVAARQDRTQETTWSITWQPRSYVSLRASVAQASRTSNVVDQDFNAQVISLGAQFIY